jgi:hypothetical protein
MPHLVTIRAETSTCNFRTTRAIDEQNVYTSRGVEHTEVAAAPQKAIGISDELDVERSSESRRK